MHNLGANVENFVEKRKNIVFLKCHNYAFQA